MCIWGQEATVCQVSLPLFTCLRYPQTAQPGKEKIPDRDTGGKCQILALNPVGLEVGFAGVYTEQRCWAGLSPGQSILCLQHRLDF